MINYHYIYLGVIFVLIGILIFEKITGKVFFEKINAGKPIFEALKLLVSACNGVCPSKYFSDCEIILDATIRGVTEAEQLWLRGDLDKDQRGQYCQLLIASALKNAGIEIDDQKQEIIKGCIALICMLMPHSGIAEDVKEDKLEEAKETNNN